MDMKWEMNGQCYQSPTLYLMAWCSVCSVGVSWRAPLRTSEPGQGAVLAKGMGGSITVDMCLGSRGE